MIKRAFGIGWAVIVLTGAGCANATVEPGGEFILREIMTQIANPGPFKVFVAEDGFSYHFRQGAGLPNELFDAANTVGATSRVRVALRNDLPGQITQVGALSSLEVVVRRDVDLRCQLDDTFQVLEVIAVLMLATGTQSS